MARAARLTVRIASALALVLVATYYLLASIPFSYYQFLQFPHFWWLPPFINVHPLVFLAAAAALLWTLGDLPFALQPWRRYAAIGAASGGVCMMGVAWMPRLMSYEVAAALCFVPLMVLALIGGIALAADRGLSSAVARPRHDATLFIVAGATAGTMCSAVYFVDAAIRGAQGSLRLREIAVAAAASIVTHVALFVIAALVAFAINRAAVWRRWPLWLERVAVGSWMAIVLAVLIRRSILTALILNDGRANAVAAALSIALVVFSAAVRAGRAPEGNADRWPRAAATTLIIAVSVGVLPRMLLFADWGSTLQKLLVLASWTAVALFVSTYARTGQYATLAAGLTAIVVAAVAGGNGAGKGRPSTADDRRPIDVALAIDRYATFDMSLTVLLDVVRPFVADDEFFRALQRAGELTGDSSLPAVPLHAVDQPRQTSAYRPNIFIVVVDSLRPDYLSAYNPDVTFTPAIGAFAAESLVMRHAFTSYAGTALSEPSLWAGGLIPRAIYVKPFSPMNNLERLVQLDGYRRYISVDEVLYDIIDDWTGVERLDTYLADPQRADVFKLDLCPTLRELAGRLDRDAGDRPVFFYSQPKSLHIRVLVGEEQYPRYEGLRIGNAVFFKPAATVVQRLDACFGTFIDYLKSSGKYDDSIIVLTSDHGDAYGEGGRWGHAFYLAPETMRIPLIMHLPARLRTGRAADLDAVAMLTDVTPTLYDLLGLRPNNTSGLLGRSLLPRVDAAAPEADQDVALVQSSYARVFGLIDRHGQWMYSADVEHAREQLFDLNDAGPYPKRLPAADRLLYRKWLLERLNMVGHYYRQRSGS
jgi:hypothetical protein